MLPGDGIRTEVVADCRQVPEAIAKAGGHIFTLTDHLIGGIAIDEEGRRSRMRRSRCAVRPRLCCSARWAQVTCLSLEAYA